MEIVGVQYHYSEDSKAVREPANAKNVGLIE